MGMFDMKNSFAIALSLVAVALPATAANAATTVDIKTGTAGTGAIDPKWKINGNDAWAPTNINTAWFSGGAAAGTNGSSIDGAAWITPAENGNANQPVGTVAYSTVFTLADFATAANFIGTFWSDNRVASILLNGIAIYTNNDAAASQYAGTGITLNQSVNVLAGVNSLVFNVENYSGASGNPAGLRVAGLMSAVPEPGTWMLMMLGLGAVGFSMRRRQKTQVRFQFA